MRNEHTRVVWIVRGDVSATEMLELQLHSDEILHRCLIAHSTCERVDIAGSAFLLQLSQLSRRSHMTWMSQLGTHVTERSGDSLLHRFVPEGIGKEGELFERTKQKRLARSLQILNESVIGKPVDERSLERGENQRVSHLPSVNHRSENGPNAGLELLKSTIRKVFPINMIPD